jgi:hypothetical protein
MPRLSVAARKGTDSSSTMERPLMHMNVPAHYNWSGSP